GSSAETSVHGGRCPALTHDKTLARTGSLACAPCSSSAANVSLWLSPGDAACAAEPLAVTLQTCVAASTPPPSTRPGCVVLSCAVLCCFALCCAVLCDVCCAVLCCAV